VLERLLDIPDLPQVVRQLDPQILHRLVRVVGLEDCGEIVVRSRRRAVDARVRCRLVAERSSRSSRDVRCDRFGVWLEVLVEFGVSNAALKVAGLDVDFVTASHSRARGGGRSGAEVAAEVFRRLSPTAGRGGVRATLDDRTSSGRRRHMRDRWITPSSQNAVSRGMRLSPCSARSATSIRISFTS
jgi:hypothetical protein